MHAFRHHRFARSVFSAFAVLGLLLSGLGPFAPQPASAQTGSITINSHTCPVDISGMDLNQIAQNCQGSDRAGFTYEIVLQTVGTPPTYSQTTDASGLLSFNNIELGTWYIYQTANPGYTNFAAYCKVDDFLGNEKVPYHAPQLQPQIVDVVLFDGDMGYCDFFNYNAGAAPTTGSVVINKITCPDGYDGYSADIFDLALNCQDVSQVVNFALTDSNGQTSNATTPGSAVNLATFQNIPQGMLSITEEELDGYGLPRVFCKNQRIVGQSETSTEVPVNGTTAEVEFKVGYDDLYCDWFNIAYDPGYVTVTVIKHFCPEGYVSGNYSELAQNCQEPYDPVTFKLDGASSGNPGDQETGSVIPNGVQWSGLESDTWFILEFTPDGYGEPIVFCKLISNDDQSESPLEQVPVEIVDDGHRIAYDVADFYTLYCDWFNITDTPYVGIYVHKYGCQEGYETDWGLQEWSQYCTTIVRDSSFTVEYSDGTSYEQNLNGIDLAWEFLPPGDYEVREEHSTAWTDSVIFCAVGSYNGDTGNYERLNTSDSSFSWSLGGYEYLDCYWYNLARPRPVATIDPNAPATLTIVKYTCEEDYEPLATDADPEDDCEELTDGVTFSVIGSQDASVSAETGEDGEGTVTFSGLRPGSYLLRETYPEDVSKGFIWTCESDFRVFDYPFTPFARIDESGTIKISLTPGETLVCTWFNVPSPPEEEPIDGAGEGEVAVTINVFECGSGVLNPSACDPVSEGVGVSLTSTTGDGDPIDLETDDTGVASGSVAADEYDIDADEPICIADSSAFTEDSTLDLTEEDAVEVDVYLCAA